MTVEGNDIESLSAHLGTLSAGERIAQLAQQYPNGVVASTSFGLQAAVMLHLLKEHAPEIPVVFIDTGYLFPETYHYAEQLTSLLGTPLKIYQAQKSAAWQEAAYGKLWEQGPTGLESYALLNKVEPMNRALRQLNAKVWLSGLRRTQSSTRKQRPFLEKQSKTLKAYPILDWTDEKVLDYFHTHSLPTHPLADEYVTMGDWHSTKKAQEADSAEETRFNGEKYECGLHERSGVQDFQI